MSSGEIDDTTGPIVEVDGKPTADLVSSLAGMIQERNDEIQEVKLEYRGILKEIREALDNISAFSSDPLSDHQSACMTINDILEDNGV